MIIPVASYFCPLALVFPPYARDVVVKLFAHIEYSPEMVLLDYYKL